MKRIVIITFIIAVILIGLLIAPLLACDQNAVIKQEKVNETSMFVVVETTLEWEVVYHKQTKVMYVYSKTHIGGGEARCNSGFTVLLDANGMPLLWKGE